MGETELQMIERHIREGEAVVARQVQLIAHLTTRGLPTDFAVELLGKFEHTLTSHRDHLARYLQELRDLGD